MLVTMMMCNNFYGDDVDDDGGWFNGNDLKHLQLLN